MKMGFLFAVQKIKKIFQALLQHRREFYIRLIEWWQFKFKYQFTFVIKMLKSLPSASSHLVYMLPDIQQLNTVLLLFEIIQFTKDNHSFYQGIFATWQLCLAICPSFAHRSTYITPVN